VRNWGSLSFPVLAFMSSRSSLRVLIPDGEFDHTLKVVRCLVCSSLAETVSVHVSGKGDMSRQLRLSRHVAGVYPFPELLSETDHIQSILDVIETARADVLLPVSKEGGQLIARHRAAFDGPVAVAPLADEETLQVAVDKGRLAAFMAAHDIPHPIAVPMRPVATLPERLGGPFPVLLKATASGGGLHIYRAEDLDTLLRYAQRLDDDCQDYVVQPYIEGMDICHLVLAEKGRVLAATTQRALATPSVAFAPLEFIEFTDDPHVDALGRKLLEALQYTGVACIDLRYDPARDALYVLEINPRFWRSLLGALRAGVNFPELACRVALKESLPAVECDDIQYAVGSLALKRIGRCMRRGIPLRNSCMAHGIADPLPVLAEFVEPKLKRFLDSRLGRSVTGWISGDVQDLR
jgi:D-aspartate ligase